MAGKTGRSGGATTRRIVPTGELDGRQDRGPVVSNGEVIVPTGELDGRQDHRGAEAVPRGLYQLGNWMAGKTIA